MTAAVGTVTVKGSATIRTNRITVKGEGTDIWSTADGFQFVYRRLTGDRQITARIMSLQNTDGWAKGGVMIRQGLNAGSVHASLLLTPLNGIVFEHRTAAGALTTRVGVTGAAPKWLRLSRRGASVTASISSDGVTWVVVGTQNVPMSADVLIGMAVTSRRPSVLATAAFERVEIATAAAAPAPAGPVAAWSFDDGAGTVLRASVGGLHGLVTGATWTAGRTGGALFFNGVDNVVTVAANAALSLTTGMTVEAWVNPVALLNWRNIAMKEGTSDLSYALYASDAASMPQSLINTGAGHLGAAGAAQLNANVWSHLAATFDGSTHRLFVNGVLVDSKSAPGTLTQTSGPFRIGGNPVWGDWFNGAIDDMRVYNRALSASEVQVDMNTPVAPPPADTRPPTIAITSPAAGATLSGTVTVGATASDDVEVASVQFLLNGTNYGAPVTTAPYGMLWNTTSAANGTFTLKAVARDFAGNVAVSPEVPVAVVNSTVSVSNGRFVKFRSADQASTLPDGRATVSGYTLEVWLPGSNTWTGTPYRSTAISKPASSSLEITTDQQAFFSALPKAQAFFTTVTASGPGGSGRSAPSNTFIMQ